MSTISCYISFQLQGAKKGSINETSLLVVVMDAVDLERLGDNVGNTIKTLTTHHTAETARMVALTTGS